MGRLARWAFTLSAAVSAVLFMGVCVLWVRSYVVADHVIWGGPRHIVFATPSQGRISLFCMIGKPGQTMGTTILRRETSKPEALDDSRQRWVVRYLHVPGLTVRTGAAEVARAMFDVTVSCWLVLCFAGMLPARWVILYRGRWRRESRRRAGRCIVCGYDLRASSDRCPECGTPIKSTSV